MWNPSRCTHWPLCVGVPEESVRCDDAVLWAAIYSRDIYLESSSSRQTRKERRGRREKPKTNRHQIEDGQTDRIHT